MKPIFFLICTLLLMQNHAHSDFFVGNGGDGIQKDGKIFLRDLYEFENLSPYVGKPDNSMLVPLARIPQFANIPIDYDIVSSKLSHLNQIVPGLGHIVILNLKNYLFDLKFHEIPLLPELASEPIKKDRVQLAVRKNYEIYFSEPSLKKMDPVQVAALLIHESFYSLIKPVCRSSGLCEQPVQPIREIVNLSFRPDAHENFDLKDKIYTFLNLPPRDKSCQGDGTKIEISVYSSSNQPIYNTVLVDELYSESIKSKVDFFCKETFQNLPKSNLVVFDLSQKYLYSRTKWYQAYYGPQHAFGIDIGLLRKKVSIENLSVENCLPKALEYFHEWQTSIRYPKIDLYCQKK